MTESSATAVMDPSTAFAAELRERVDAYFRERGGNRHATPSMVVKTILLVGVYAGSYAWLLSGAPTLLQMWLLAALMGVAMAGIGFSVSHDSLHGAYSSQNWKNDLIGWSFDALGASSYLWKLTHNKIHHTFTNVHSLDEDLEVSPLLRLSPYTPHQPIHRFQHIYGLFAYCLTTIYWVFVKDYMYFFRPKLGPYRDKGHPWSAWMALFGGKALYYLFMIVVPLMVLDVTWWQFAIGFATFHLMGGFILGVVFQLAHVVEDTEQLTSDHSLNSRAKWIEYQLRTTNDFAPDSKITTWFCGGLNLQVEHHLFPKICHVHYPALRTIVAELAAKHGLPYHCHTSLTGALRSHLRQLRYLADGREVPGSSAPAGVPASLPQAAFDRG